MLLGGCLLAALPSPAAEGREDAKSRDRADAVLSLALAHDLEVQGRKAKSPLALITAAEIIHKIKLPMEDLNVEPKVEVKEGRPVAEEKAPPPPTLREQEQLLLADARSLIDKLVKGNELNKAEADALRTMAARVEKMKVERGAVGGPKQRNGVLRPGYTHAYRLDFEGKVTAYVRIFGNEKTSLQVTVTDETGKVCGVDAGYNPGGTWVPELAGIHAFTIRVTNSGTAGTPYRLVTN
jgi:hypothetical protein